MELVQEIHQLLMDREDTCHRTCFSLQVRGLIILFIIIFILITVTLPQLEGNTLDNFAELKTVEGLKEGSLVKVGEKDDYDVHNDDDADDDDEDVGAGGGGAVHDEGGQDPRASRQVTLILSFPLYLSILEPESETETTIISLWPARDLLKSIEPGDAYNGVDCASLSFLNTVSVYGVGCRSRL